jgi:hypothetical protein
MRFPFAKHNDQVDALTHLAWIAESPMVNPVVMGATAGRASSACFPGDLGLLQKEIIRYAAQTHAPMVASAERLC